MPLPRRAAPAAAAAAAVFNAVASIVAASIFARAASSFAAFAGEALHIECAKQSTVHNVSAVNGGRKGKATGKNGECARWPG